MMVWCWICRCFAVGLLISAVVSPSPLSPDQRVTFLGIAALWAIAGRES
jgi:hypothetical protein